MSKIFHEPMDANGKDLKVGDWVRVISIPSSIKNMPKDTREAFSKAVGHTLQIEDFGEDGSLELDMWPKISLDSIWLEPYCCLRFRRYKKHSKHFQKIIKMRNELDDKYAT